MRGQRTSEEVNRLLAARIGMPFEELWELFITDCETMQVLPGVLEKIQSLRNEYIVILITGNMDCFMRFTVPALELQKYFDLVSSSYDEKMSKTDNDGEVFKKYIVKYQAPIESCVVIDDSARVCSTFELLGGTAYHISDDMDVICHLNNLKTRFMQNSV